MKKVMEVVEHKDVFNTFSHIRESIQEPIAKELKRKFVLGLYGSPYCTECGRPAEFTIEKNSKDVKAIFICKPCGDEEKKSPLTEWYMP